jgi:hypothetical protein
MSGGTSAATAAGGTAAAASSSAAAAGTTAAVTSEAAADAAAATAAASAADGGGSIAAADAAATTAAETAAAGSTLSISNGTLLSLAGTGFSALQQMKAGSQAKSAADYNAAVQGQQANAEAAGGERQAFAQNQQTNLLLSRARALGAAGGATATSPSVIADESQIKDRGDLNAMMDLYNGESRAQSLQEGAALQQYQGDQAESAAPLKALSTIMGGASSLYTRYSPNPFSTVGTAMNNNF